MNQVFSFKVNLGRVLQIVIFVKRQNFVFWMNQSDCQCSATYPLIILSSPCRYVMRNLLSFRVSVFPFINFQFWFVTNRGQNVVAFGMIHFWILIVELTFENVLPENHVARSLNWKLTIVFLKLKVETRFWDSKIHIF